MHRCRCFERLHKSFAPIAEGARRFRTVRHWGSLPGPIHPGGLLCGGSLKSERNPSSEMWPDLVHEIGPRSNGVCTRKRATPPRRDSEPSLREIFRRVHGLGRAAIGLGNTVFRGCTCKTDQEYEKESLPKRIRTTSTGFSSTTVETAANPPIDADASPRNTQAGPGLESTQNEKRDKVSDFHRTTVMLYDSHAIEP
ncbi:MAG: hypothetical protein RIS70_2665 [Planctomycetota bacterium]